jgi:uncharacterized protein
VTITLLRASDRIERPWKNGGGATREIAISPERTGFVDFDWRISMATVAAAGPFSLFPGIERMLVVLSGRMRLTIKGRGVHDLTPDSPPLTFPGDIDVHGEAIGGPVVDLNLMVRRDRYGGIMHRQEQAGTTVVDEKESVIVLAQTPFVVLGRNQSIDAAPLDAIRIEGPDRVQVPGGSIRISIRRLQPLRSGL